MRLGKTKKRRVKFSHRGWFKGLSFGLDICQRKYNPPLINHSNLLFVSFISSWINLKDGVFTSRKILLL
jgi:hypothetical protein